VNGKRELQVRRNVVKGGRGGYSMLTIGIFLTVINAKVNTMTITIIAVMKLSRMEPQNTILAYPSTVFLFQVLAPCPILTDNYPHLR